MKSDPGSMDHFPQGGEGPSLFHRLLLLAYPTAFRKDWGEDVLRFWKAQAREFRYRGPWGRTCLRGALILDALSSGFRMRTRDLIGHGGEEDQEQYKPRKENLMKSILQDMAYALRTLRGSPLYSAVVVLTLALGIGATAAVFSVVETVVLRPLPFPEPEQLVRVLRTMVEDETQTLTWLDFRDYREGATGLSGMTAYSETQETFGWEGGAQELDGARVTHDFFSVVGVSPSLGRGFTPEEDRMGGPRAVVISHGLWQEHFGGDPRVLERTIPMGGEEVPVVGIMPRGFSFPYGNTWFWTPLREEEVLDELGLPTGLRSLNFLDALGRLDPGVGLEGAQLQLRTLARSIDEAEGKPQDLYTDIHLASLQENMVGDADTTLFFLLAAAGLVLVVACANVAGLSFSRATMRERELAVRSALGAARGRILRQLLTESVLLSLAAGGVGMVFAVGLQRALLALAPEGIPNLQALAFNATSLLFVGGVTVASGLLFGFFPALKASTIEVAAGLAGGRGASGSRKALRPQQLLVTFQVGLAVVLLVGATLLTTSFLRLNGVDRGFQSESVLLATVALDTDAYPTPDQVDQFYSTLLERISAMPGVLKASTTFSPPLAGNDFFTSVVPEGVEEEPSDMEWAGMIVAREGYFDANGIPLLQGRDFNSGDLLGEPLVAIVNQTMANKLWPGEDPLGKRFLFGNGVRGTAESFNRTFFPGGYYTVVGVAGDVRRVNLAEPSGMEYYRPHTQVTWGYQYLVIQTSGDPASVAGNLRQVVWGVDPTVPVRTVRTLSSQVGESLSVERFRTFLLSGFAVLTCFLAMVGLYAVMALAVARRAKEMGIRLALGAGSGVILGGVLRKGLALVGIGLVFGLAVSLAIGKTLSGMLFEIEPSDPVTYLLVSLLTTGVALVACYVPARRASRVDPLRTLQEE